MNPLKKTPSRPKEPHITINPPKTSSPEGKPLQYKILHIIEVLGYLSALFTHFFIVSFPIVLLGLGLDAFLVDTLSGTKYETNIDLIRAGMIVTGFCLALLLMKMSGKFLTRIFQPDNTDYETRGHLSHFQKYTFAFVAFLACTELIRFLEEISSLNIGPLSNIPSLLYGYYAWKKSESWVSRLLKTQNPRNIDL